MRDRFEIVGIRPFPESAKGETAKSKKRKPPLALLLLGMIAAGCLACELIITRDPSYMDLQNCNVPPGGRFLFGTDTMGRDIFSMIWYGGRVSLLIGIAGAAVSTFIGVVYGAASGWAPVWLDGLMMRSVDILLGVPELLLLIFLQAILGEASVVSLSLVIGATGWFGIAKVVRTEVRQIRDTEYVAAARCMGGGFFYVLVRHLIPNFVSSLMFMVVMNIRSGIAAEATLSFLGLGLPLSVVSWGSMLSLAEKALLARSWWIILIPGIFLVTTLFCITSLGNRLRKSGNRKERNL